MPKRESIRVDRKLTAQRRADGTYADPRSCVHQDSREYLRGVDVGNRRRQIWERDKRKCVKCLSYVTWEGFEMHHLEKFAGRRFDNADNLVTLCRKCHQSGHIQVQWTKTQQEA